MKPSDLLAEYVLSKIIVADFGLVIQASSAKSPDGSRPYWASEVHLNDGIIPFKSKVDVYSLGIVFLELTNINAPLTRLCD